MLSVALPARLEAAPFQDTCLQPVLRTCKILLSAHSIAALKALPHPPIRSSDEILTNFYANLRNRETFRVILSIEGFAFILRR